MKKLLLFLLSAIACAQQPQIAITPQAIQSLNAKWVQGVGIGFAPTRGSLLTLNIGVGTCFDAGGTRHAYTGGTITVTNAVTSYVSLASADCSFVQSTSAYTAGNQRLYSVVASGGVITSYNDDRTWFSPGCGTLTGDVTSVGCATTLANIPTGATMAGYILATNIAAPATPASAHDALYVDSTDLRFHDKNASGVIGTTAVAKTAATHKFFNAMSAAGVFTDTQPDYGDLTGTPGACTTCVLASSPGVGVAHFAGSTQTVTSSAVVDSDLSLTAPAIGAATATSLLATGIVDGKAPVDITTGSSASLGGTYKSGYTLNQEATAATAVTYTLPTAAAGLQYCVKNSYNGSAADTGTLRFSTSASGQYIIFNGTLSATNGYIISGGAAGDAACVVGIDSTHWEFYTQSGTWTIH